MKHCGNNHCMKLRLLLLSLLLTTSSFVAHAQLINVDTLSPNGPYTATTMTGPAVLGISSTDQWNTITQTYFGNSVNLTDSTGATNGVSLFYQNIGSNSGAPASDGNLAPALFQNALGASNGSLLNGNAFTSFNFSGLEDSTDYTLELYTINGQAIGYDPTTNSTFDGVADLTFTLNGISTTLDQVPSTTYTSDYVSPGVYSGNYVQLTGSTDASGNLNLTVANASSNTVGNYFLSGIQLEPAAVVPEPSTDAMMLAGLGALLFLIARKRRKEFSHSL
jgi:hypothetical protein